MKKVFFILAIVAATLSSCMEEPTAVLPENMDGSVTVIGYVYQKKEGASDASVCRNHAVTLLRGTKSGEKMFYTKYNATTDDKGRFSMQIGVPAGKTIDEVKIEASDMIEREHEMSGAGLVDTYYYGSDKKTDLLEGKTYVLKITMTACAYDAYKGYQP